MATSEGMAKGEDSARSETKPAALVVGVGPGLGAALVRRFSREGMAVAIAARRLDRLKDLANETGGRAYACDATSEISVDDLFAAVARDLGPARLVVFNASGFTRKPVVELTPAEVESCWRASCLGGFLVGRAAARTMLPAGPGTILLTGATAALRGSANFAAFAIGKFGLRALAQSMARELGPLGIHVGHVIIDGSIGETGAESRLSPDAIADSYWHLHCQPKSAWTLELDLRPWAEKF
jgi:NAD(P)-dependent dehydrogenase (short-subunit alcohol dehydrogenase family)